MKELLTNIFLVFFKIPAGQGVAPNITTKTISWTRAWSSSANRFSNPLPLTKIQKKDQSPRANFITSCGAHIVRIRSGQYGWNRPLIKKISTFI